MAAFVAVKPLSLRPSLGFGHSGLLQQFSLRTRVAVPASLCCRLPLSLRCSAEEKPEPEDTEKSEGAVKPEAAEDGHSAIEEEFGGWSTVVSEPESEGSWKAGALRFGAGVVLALGISLVSYSYFEKQGKRATQSPPPQASSQESKVLNEAPPQREKTSKASSHFDDDDDVTFDEYTKKDDGDDFDEGIEDVDNVGKQQDRFDVLSSVRNQDVTSKTDHNDAKAANESDSGIKKYDLWLLSLNPVGKIQVSIRIGWNRYCYLGNLL